MVANGLQFLEERSSGPQQRVIMWTPAMAEAAFTTFNTHERQRGFRKNHAEMLKRIMDEGKWREPWYQTWIAFEDGSRSVVNGQHTLWAIWQHAKPVKVWTAWGLDNTSICSFDNFKARTVGVLATQAGLDHVNVRNGVTKMRMSIDEGHEQHVAVTVSDTIRLTVDDPIMDACIRHCANHKHRKEMRSLVTVAYAMWRIANVHGLPYTFGFIDATFEGVNMQAQDPRLHLGRFIRQRPVHTYAERCLMVVGVIRSFNMWVSGSGIERGGLHVKYGAKIPPVYGSNPD